MKQEIEIREDLDFSVLEKDMDYFEDGLQEFEYIGPSEIKFVWGDTYRNKRTGYDYLVRIPKPAQVDMARDDKSVEPTWDYEFACWKWPRIRWTETRPDCYWNGNHLAERSECRNCKGEIKPYKRMYARQLRGDVYFLEGEVTCMCENCARVQAMIIETHTWGRGYDQYTMYWKDSNTPVLTVTAGTARSVEKAVFYA